MRIRGKKCCRGSKEDWAQQQQQGLEFSAKNNEDSHTYIHLASQLPLPQSLNLMLDAHWYSNAQNKKPNKHQTPDRSPVQATGMDRVKKWVGIKSSGEDFFSPQYLQQVGGKKNATSTKALCGSWDCATARSKPPKLHENESGAKWWSWLVPLYRPEMNRVNKALHSRHLRAAIQLPIELPGDSCLCVRCVPTLRKWIAPVLYPCVMEALQCCREPSTLNLNYLHTESSNCGRQEAVNLTQLFMLLLSSALFWIWAAPNLRSCLWAYYWGGGLQIMQDNISERGWLCL